MMKTFLFSSLLLFSFVNLFSQDSIYFSTCRGLYDGNSTGFNTHVNRYDSAGNIIREDEIGYSIDAAGNGYPPTGFRSYIIYDYSNNHISHRTYYQSDANGNFTIITENSYDYDVNGNRITDTIYYNGIPNQYYKYSWNSQHDTISIEWYPDSSGVFILKDLKAIQRDINSRPVDRIHYTYSNGQPSNIDRQIISYDNFGNIASYNSLTGTFNGWTDDWRLLYHYSSNGLLDAYGKSTFNNGSWLMNDSLNTIFNSDSTISHSMYARWYNFNLDDSSVSDFTYDLNRQILQQNRDHYYYQGQFWIHDSERIVVNRLTDGTPLDSTYMIFNGTSFQNQALYLFHYSGPGTVDLYTVGCINGVCQDTNALQQTIYFSPGNSYTQELFDVSQWGISSYANSGATYNSLNQVVEDYYNWNVPGEQFHTHSIHDYDANGNLLHSWQGQSNHAGTPYVETDCVYSWTITSASSLNVDLLLSDSTSCQHSPVFGLVNIMGGQGPYTISWNDSAGINYANTINPVFHPDSNVTYVLHVIDANGLQDSVTLNLHGQSYNAHLISTGFCLGDTITGIINPLPSNVNYFYLNAGGNGYSLNTVPVFILNNSNLYGYFYLSFWAECGQQAYSDSIFIDEAPYLDLGQDRTICGDDTVTITPFSYFPFTWYDGDTSLTHQFSVGGTYWATSENSVHCMTSDSIHLTNENFNISLGNDTLICTNQSLVLHAQSGLIGYHWFDNTWSQTLVFSSATPDTIEAYVIAYSAQNCTYTDTMQIITQVCAGIDEGVDDYSVSPNPCEDFLFVKTTGEAKMRMTNSSGIILINQEIFGNSYIDMRNFERGVYFLEIDGSRRWATKVVH